jgi:hypothetical protein
MTTDAVADEGLSHAVCCDDNVALCGTDVADVQWIDDDGDATCVVCRELDGQPCRICGT